MKKYYSYKGKRYSLYKENDEDKIYWVDFRGDYFGFLMFTFDGKTFFNYYADYPEKLSAEQKNIFDNENPALSDTNEIDDDDYDDDDEDDWWMK